MFDESIKSSRNEGSAGILANPLRLENVSIDLAEANEEGNGLAYDDPLQNSSSRLCDPCCLRDGSGYFHVVAAPVHELNRRYHPLSHPSADDYRRF